MWPRAFGDGIVDGIGDAGKWINEHIFQPFLKGFQKAFKVQVTFKGYERTGRLYFPSLFDGTAICGKRSSQKFKGFKDGVVNFFTGKNGVVSKVTGLGGKIVTGLRTV